MPIFVGKRRDIKQEYGDATGSLGFRKIDRTQILIGHSQADLDFLIEALKSGPDELLGKAFGFPPTAVEVFIGKRKRLDTAKLPKKAQKSDAIIFTTPCLSVDNWREEIKQGQVCADFIKKISPKLHKEWKDMYMKWVNDPSGRNIEF